MCDSPIPHPHGEGAVAAVVAVGGVVAMAGTVASWVGGLLDAVGPLLGLILVVTVLGELAVIGWAVACRRLDDRREAAIREGWAEEQQRPAICAAPIALPGAPVRAAELEARPVVRVPSWVEPVDAAGVDVESVEVRRGVA